MPTVTEQIIGFEIKGIGDFVRQFSTGTGRAAREFESRMNKATKLMENFAKKAPEHIFGKKAEKQMTKLYGRLQQSHVKSMAIVEKLSEKNLGKQEKAKLEHALQRHRILEKGLSERLKEESLAVRNWARRRKEAAKAVNNLLERGSEVQADNIKGGVEKAFSSIQHMDFSSLTQALASGLMKTGKGVATKAGGGKSAKNMTKAAKAMSTAAKSFGVALGVVGGLTAAVAALIKIFLDLDESVKDFNKSLLEGAGAADLALGSTESAAGTLEMQLQNVREAAYDVGNNLRWMTTGKEQMQILNAFNEAGFRLKDMTRNIEDAHEKMVAYQDATSVALTYSKLLGVSSSEMAKDMGALMADTGVQLEQVQEGFAKVAAIAQTSGFNVKRFYSTILEATSGTHFYNVRIEEAAALLDKFTRLLGKRPGTEFFKGLQEGFAEMSYKDRFKEIMVTGTKTTRRIIEAEAGKAADRFSETFAKNEVLQTALSDAGLNIKDAKNAGSEIAKQIGSMSGDRFAETMLALKAGNKVDAEVLNEIERMRQLEQGTSGQIGKMAIALDDMSETGVLAHKMSSVMVKNLGKSTAMQRAAFEEIKGVSGQQLEAMIRLQRDFSTGWKQLNDTTNDLAVTASKEGDVIEGMSDKTKQLADLMGAVRDSNGDVRKVIKHGNEYTLGKKLKNMEHFLVEQNAIADLASDVTEKQLTKDQEIAQEIVKNTEPINKTLEIMKDGVLERIYSVLKPLGPTILSAIMEIAKLIPGVGDAVKEIERLRTGQEMQQNFLRDNAKNIEAYSKSIELLQKQRSEATEKAKKAKDPEEKAFYTELIKKLDTDIEAAEGGLTVEKRMRKSATEVGTEDLGRFGSFLKEQFKVEKQKVAKEGGKFGGVESFVKMLERQEKDRKKKEEEKKKAELKQLDATKDQTKEEEKLAKEGFKLEERGIKLQEKMPKDVATALVLEMKKEKLKDLLRTLGVEESAINKYSNLGGNRLQKEAISALSSGWSSLGAEQRGAILEQAVRVGIKIPKGSASTQETTKAGDFIITDSGRMVEPHSDDMIVGMRPGGPLAKALEGAGSKKVVVNIYESHNPEKTYAVVKRALRDSGLTN